MLNVSLYMTKIHILSYSKLYVQIDTLVIFITCKGGGVFQGRTCERKLEVRGICRED